MGENFDYMDMKAEMVAAMTDGASESWTDFDFGLSWLELPDFDLLDFFEFLD